VITNLLHIKAKKMSNFLFLTFIISLLMSPLLEHRPFLWITHLENRHNPPRGSSAGWWVLTTTNAGGTNGLTCLPKHGGVRNNKFLVTHSMTQQRCLSSAIPKEEELRSALTAGSSPISNFSIHLYTF
jgi:hypothetical protein